MVETRMPDWRRQLDQGVAYQRGGALDRALENYLAVAKCADDPSLVSEALRRQSDIYRMHAQWDEAIAAARRAADVGAACGLPELQADALNTEATSYFYKGDFDVAVPLLERALELSNDDRVRGAALMNLGSIAGRRGQLEAAELRFNESYRCYHRAGHLRGEVLALQNYGGVALDRNDFDLACKVLQQAVVAARKINDLDLLAMANVNYAEALAGRQEYARATDCASTAVGYFTIVDNKVWRVKCLRLMGDLYVKQDDLDTARRCYELGAKLGLEIEAKLDVQRITERLEALDEGSAS